MADEKTIAVLCSAILNEFLLNPEVDESLEMEEFTELFPRKYRRHPDIKVLYEAFDLNRRKIRASVRRNVKQFCQLQQLQESDKSSDQETTSDLQEQERMWQQELNSLEQELLSSEEQLQRYIDEINGLDLFDGLSKGQFNTKKLCEVAKLLENSS